MLRLLTRRIASYLPRRPMEPEPGLCCDEGCESCVWLVYANELLDYYRQKTPHGSLDKVKNEIIDKIESPSVKAFVIGELEMAAKQFDDLSKLRKK
ncbi:unnamed protein product [Caenorhabditis angaria]|uniref:Oxidoreductase-like domain-containing protein n=1 Tax=Caenorhabditis angaria TaxID=860376 RepID=A0A9P1N2S0_9PELO|nr:unnamed protein product [Caenorhabditis angaria]